MIKVFISSKYSEGDKEQNVKDQIIAGNVLIDYGFNPFVPLLTHYLDQEKCRPYNYWINALMEWLQLCDCMLQLNSSPGADMEKVFAEKLKIPVFTSIDELLKFYNKIK
jgi:hypothetical protein